MMRVSSINRKKGLLILISILFTAMLAKLALAQPATLVDIAESMKFFNIGEAYSHAPYVVDGMIYLILFIGVAQVTLGKVFQGRGGRAAIIAVGLALATSLAFWSRESGFSLQRLGGLAFTILIIIIVMFIYKLIRGNEKLGSGIWMAIFATYVMLYVFFPEIFKILDGFPIARAVVDFLGMVAMIMFIVGIFKGKGPAAAPADWKGLTSGSNGGRSSSKTPKSSRQVAEEGEIEEDEVKEAEKLKKETEVESKLMDLEKRDMLLIEKIIDDLHLIKSMIKKYGKNDIAKGKIASILGDIKNSDTEMVANQSKIRNLIDNLRALLDQEMNLNNTLQNKIRTMFSMAPADNVIRATGQKKLLANVKQKINDEIDKIEAGIRPQMQKFEDEEKAFETNFSKIIRSLKLDNTSQAKKYTDDAIKNKKTQRDDCKAVMRVLDVIKKFNEREYQDLVKLIEDLHAGRRI